MKILLIFPPSNIYGRDLTIPAVVPPLGLCYIAGYLQNHGYEDVTVLDARSLSKDRVIRVGNRALYGLTDEEIEDYVKKIDPDIVGISCMYTAYSGDAHRVARIIKDMDQSIPLVMGGAHASTFPELVLKDNNIDFVAHLEGEQTFLELVRCLEKKGDVSTVQGISFMKDGALHKNPERPFIDDLDTIPMPARHLIDIDLYLDNKPGPFAMRAPSTTFITSRGCPQSCVFCTIKSVWGDMNFRARSPKNVVDELEHLHREYGIREFYWMDDAAGTTKKRLIDICDEIIARKLDIKWTTPNGIAHWYLDEKVLDKMKAAGCYRVTFGIESGNVETRKYLGKPFGLDQATRMLAHANKIGMWTICTFIMGFPFETEEDIDETIDYACKSGTDLAIFYLLCPHPGTDVYEDFSEEGLLNFDTVMDPTMELKDKDFEEIGTKLAGAGSQTKTLSSDRLNELLTLAYKRFFKVRLKNSLNPMRTLQKIQNTEDLRYTIKIAKSGLTSALKSLKGKGFRSQKLRKRANEELEDFEQLKNNVKLPLKASYGE